MAFHFIQMALPHTWLNEPRSNTHEQWSFLNSHTDPQFRNTWLSTGERFVTKTSEPLHSLKVPPTIYLGRLCSTKQHG